MKYGWIDGQKIAIPELYVTESMFFNPRRDKAVYLIRAGDKILTKTRLGLTWLTIVEGDAAIGVNFKELLKTDENIKMLAIPLKFEFGDESIFSLKGYFSWSALGSGFGQMSFGRSEEDGKIHFDTEMMGPETTRKMLHDLVDYIVDNGVSDDWNPRDYVYPDDEATENE